MIPMLKGFLRHSSKGSPQNLQGLSIKALQHVAILKNSLEGLLENFLDDLENSLEIFF